MSNATNAVTRMEGGETEGIALSSGGVDLYLAQTALMQLYSSSLIHIHSRY